MHHFVGRPETQGKNATCFWLSGRDLTPHTIIKYCTVTCLGPLFFCSYYTQHCALCHSWCPFDTDLWERGQIALCLLTNLTLLLSLWALWLGVFVCDLTVVYLAKRRPKGITRSSTSPQLVMQRRFKEATPSRMKLLLQQDRGRLGRYLNLTFAWCIQIHKMHYYTLITKIEF